MVLVARLRAELAARSWGPARLDREARLPQGCVARYLDGRSPTVRSLGALAEALGTTPSDLLDPARIPGGTA